MVKRMHFSSIRYFVLFLVIWIGAGVVAAQNATQNATPIGGDMGTYRVHVNVEGASVYFDGQLMGTIKDGILDVPVYVTGTPYRT